MPLIFITGGVRSGKSHLQSKQRFSIMRRSQVQRNACSIWHLVLP